MKIINVRAGVQLDSMATGETFIYDDDYYLISDYHNNFGKVACINLLSGYTLFLNYETIVVPVTAEVHIL